MKKICIICHTDIQNDPRVYRQVTHFAKTCRVTVVGNGPQLTMLNVTMYSWGQCYRVAANIFEKTYYLCALLFRMYSILERRFSVKTLPDLEAERFDYVIVNEINSLVLGFHLAKGSPVHCDLHEYYLDEPQSLRDKIARPYVMWLCRAYLPRCSSLSTVSQGLADAYEQLAEKRPALVINAPQFQRLAPGPVSDHTIRLVHHGYADPNRQLEKLIELMDFVDERYTLTLMLTTDSPYREQLRQMTQKRANIHWTEPVPMHEICCAINQYDLGVILYHADCFNITHSLPNKFFEFIQARLGIASGPSVEIEPFIRKYDIGVVADDFTPQALAYRLNALSKEDVMRFKRNTNAIAAEYSAELSMQVLQTALSL
jgi:hypothetical protein